jgi:hypothetical protein
MSRPPSFAYIVGRVATLPSNVLINANPIDFNSRGGTGSNSVPWWKLYPT